MRAEVRAVPRAARESISPERPAPHRWSARHWKSPANSSEYKSTAWFVGYAPSDKPEIVVAALVQRGEHSAVAVPIVREVIKAYFDKKLGHQASG